MGRKARFLCYIISMNIDLSRLQLPELIVMAVLGVALILFGYRIKKIAFFVIWFLLGFNLVSMLMPQLTAIAQQPALESELWQNLLPVAGGLLLALLGFSIEKICIGGIAFALILMITVQYFGTEIQTLAIGGIIGVIAAGAAVMLMKPAIIIATSLAGAYAVTMAILVWSGLNATVYYFPFLIGLTIVGTVIQLMTTKHID